MNHEVRSQEILFMDLIEQKDLNPRIWRPLSTEESKSPAGKHGRDLHLLTFTQEDGREGEWKPTPPLTDKYIQPEDELVTKQQSLVDLEPVIKKISLCHKTPFQKRVLLALCQVPPGQYTTYGVMSKHLSSSPRAVGNALRNNPFAPQAPCHRVLASGGSIGGFEGSWGRNGKAGLNDDKKRKLLRGEGVKFDGRGRVVGKPWDSFK